MQHIDLLVNEIRLSGIIISPQKMLEKNPAILFIHGWTSEKSRSYQYTNALIKLGYLCFLFDMRGHGESQGDINTATPKEFLDDVLAAYDYLANLENVDKENISAIGSSFGGYLAALLSAKRKIKHLALRVPADYANNSFNKPKMGNAGENPEILKWRLTPKNFNETFALQALHEFTGSILIIESEKDTIVPHQIIQNYLDAVKDKHKLTHVVMKNAPHTIKEGPFRNEVEKILTNWFGNRI